jgi:hypothetical protein
MNDSVETLGEFLSRGDSTFNLGEEFVLVSEHLDAIEVGIDVGYEVLAVEDSSVKLERNTSVAWWRVSTQESKKLQKTLLAEITKYGHEKFLSDLKSILAETGPGDDGDDEGFDDFQEKDCSPVEAAFTYELLREHPELVDLALELDAGDELIAEASQSFWAEGVFHLVSLTESRPELMEALAASEEFLDQLASLIRKEDMPTYAVPAIYHLANRAHHTTCLQAVAMSFSIPDDIFAELLNHEDAGVSQAAQEHLDDMG